MRTQRVIVMDLILYSLNNHASAQVSISWPQKIRQDVFYLVDQAYSRRGVVARSAETFVSHRRHVLTTSNPSINILSTFRGGGGFSQGLLELVNLLRTTDLCSDPDRSLVDDRVPKAKPKTCQCCRNSSSNTLPIEGRRLDELRHFLRTGPQNRPHHRTPYQLASRCVGTRTV